MVPYSSILYGKFHVLKSKKNQTCLLVLLDGSIIHLIAYPNHIVKLLHSQRRQY